LDLLNKLLNEANEPNTPLERADTFAYVVLSSLPWVCDLSSRALVSTPNHDIVVVVRPKTL